MHVTKTKTFLLYLIVDLLLCQFNGEIFAFLTDKKKNNDTKFKQLSRVEYGAILKFIYTQDEEKNRWYDDDEIPRDMSRFSMLCI